MSIDLNSIKDKQRIAIIGNEGTNEITKIAIHVLANIGKHFDYILSDDNYKITDAPIVLIKGDDHILDGKKYAEFLKYNHHIAVIHHIMESYPKEYASFEEYIDQYETLADRTPKSGTLLYNKEDDLAMVIGEKQREGVTLLEYESLFGQKTDKGFILDGNIKVTTNNKHFLSHAGAAKGLLRRISVSESQILEALSTYHD
jgi:UDP-N-acetylmuramate: L-alanyl-gamma-D-glutamyl-meso-diaminopimelate ligase